MKFDKRFLIAGSIAILACNMANAKSDTTMCLKDAKITEFTLQNHSITDGQKFDGIKITDSCIEVLAGKKGDEKNVKFIKDNMGDSWDKDNMTVSDGKGSTPDKLNFVIYGSLHIAIDNVNYTCNNINIAQGHHVYNNWWLFSNNSNKEHTITCTNDDNGSVHDLYVFRGVEGYEFFINTENKDQTSSAHIVVA